MKGHLYKVRRTAWFRELFIPDAGILVSWAMGGTNLQVAHAKELPDDGGSSREKLRDVHVPHGTLRALQKHLEQQQARENGMNLIALAAKQSEDKLRGALSVLNLPK